MKDAGLLLAQVNTVEDKAGTRFVGVNAGLGILNLAAYYGIPYVVAPLRLRPGAPRERVTISGNINEAIDLLAEDVEVAGARGGRLPRAAQRRRLRLGGRLEPLHARAFRELLLPAEEREALAGL